MKKLVRRATRHFPLTLGAIIGLVLAVLIGAILDAAFPHWRSH